MNFCAAILILKTEDIQHFQHIMLYYYKKGKNTTEMQKICAALAGVAQWIEYQPVTERLQVQFPIGAHAWVVGWVPS